MYRLTQLVIVLLFPFVSLNATAIAMQSSTGLTGDDVQQPALPESHTTQEIEG